jgi:hypothetical protein
VRDLDAAGAVRDGLNQGLATASDHREIARLGDELSAAQRRVDAAEEAWLSLAAEAESLGLDVDG